MSNNNGMQDTQESKYVEFMYSTQYKRLLNPMYIFLTKAGFFSTLFYVYLRMNGREGVILFLIYFLFLYWIYKSDFNYRYYEKDKIWLISLLVKLLNKKTPRTFSGWSALEDAKDGMSSSKKN